MYDEKIYGMSFESIVVKCIIEFKRTIIIQLNTI